MSIKSEVRRVQHEAIDSLRSASRELSHAMRDLMTNEVSKTLGLSTTVRSLMSAEVRTCRADDTLEQAARTLWEHDCGALPVIDQGRAIAMLTDRDICMATFTQNQAPSRIAVSRAMSKQLFTCSPDDSIGSALSTMGHQRVRRLPIVGHNGELLGLLSMADLARWARSLSSFAVHAALVDAEGSIAMRKPTEMPVAAE